MSQEPEFNSAAEQLSMYANEMAQERHARIQAAVEVKRLQQENEQLRNRLQILEAEIEGFRAESPKD